MAALPLGRLTLYKCLLQTLGKLLNIVLDPASDLQRDPLPSGRPHAFPSPPPIWNQVTAVKRKAAELKAPKSKNLGYKSMDSI